MDYSGRMPVVFVGHGSPLYTLDHEEYIASWKDLGSKLPRPKGILSISAHWVTKGIQTLCQPANDLIYDFGGFPQALYAIQYETRGISGIKERLEPIFDGSVTCGHWGLDHGTWTVLRHMYPEGDVPVSQLSLSSTASAAEQYAVGKKLAVLRDEGYLILGSGNIIHNLGILSFQLERSGYPWAEDLRAQFTEAILKREDARLVDYTRFGSHMDKAFRTTEHYYPFLTVLGASEGETQVRLFNDHCVYGSLSMTSFVVG